MAFSTSLSEATARVTFRTLEKNLLCLEHGGAALSQQAVPDRNEQALCRAAPTAGEGGMSSSRRSHSLGA